MSLNGTSPAIALETYERALQSDHISGAPYLEVIQKQQQRRDVLVTSGSGGDAVRAYQDTIRNDPCITSTSAVRDSSKGGGGGDKSDKAVIAAAGHRPPPKHLIAACLCRLSVLAKVHFQSKMHHIVLGRSLLILQRPDDAFYFNHNVEALEERDATMKALPANAPPQNMGRPPLNMGS